MTQDVQDAVLDGVTKVYAGDVTAVDDVSLAVRQGEFFSILGPSGCGKSTLLRILAGIETHSSGHVQIGGQDASRLPANKRPTNLIFQRLALFPHLSVSENVAFGPRVQRRPAKEVRTTVEEMLALVELKGYGARKPSQLSGGQQQRVAIARALACGPRVLLLDEPLGALDLKLRVQMQVALKKIQRDSGTTFVFVTHDQTEALAMSDRVAVMNAGRVEQVGTPEALYHRPTTRFVATFLGDTNLLPAEDAAGLVGETTGGAPAVPRGTLSIRPEVLAVAAADAPRGRPGVVVERTFEGASVRLVVRPEAGATELVARVPSRGALVPEVGDRVRLSCRAEDAVPVADLPG